VTSEPTQATGASVDQGGSSHAIRPANPRRSSQPVVSPYSRGALPVAESAIPPAVRRRLALRGFAVGLACLALSVGLAILLCLALFGNAGLS